MAPSAPLMRGISPWLRALTASTILLGGLSPMTITCLGGFAFFAITAARLGGLTIFTVAATWLGGRASLTAGVTMLGGLAIFTLTSTFSGALSRRTAQGLFAGRHRRITNRHPGRAHSARVTTSSGRADTAKRGVLFWVNRAHFLGGRRRTLGRVHRNRFRWREQGGRWGCFGNQGTGGSRLSFHCR